MSAAANFEMADDMAEWGAELNAGRAGKLTGAELNCTIAAKALPTNWPARRAPNGLTRQGRDMHQADTCTATDERGVEGQWESADAEVIAMAGRFIGRLSIWLLKASVALFVALLLADALNAGLMRLAA